MTPARAATPQDLRRLEAFASFSDELLERLTEIAVAEGYAENKVILGLGQAVEGFFVVQMGRVKMCRPDGFGENLILAIFHPGQLFGVAPGIGGEPCTASFIALEPSRCLFFESAKLYACLEASPALIRELMPLLTRRMSECTNCIVEVSSAKVERRFARLLERLAEDVGRAEGSSIFVPVRLSRQELADLTRTRVETSIRVMSRWQKEGVVETRPDGFLILEPTTIQGLSRP